MKKEEERQNVTRNQILQCLSKCERPVHIALSAGSLFITEILKDSLRNTNLGYYCAREVSRGNGLTSPQGKER